jgi:cobalt-zinc-cadmium efflux system membrane fusion protein
MKLSLTCSTCRAKNIHNNREVMKPIKYCPIATLMVSLLFALYSCSDSKSSEQKPVNEATNEKPAAEKADQGNGLIELTSQQIKAVSIEIGNIEQKNLNAVVKASGQLAVPPQNRAEVNVLMGGIIRTITVLEGHSVKKGQVVATLENPELIKIQQDYLTTKSTFAYTQSELQRQKELSEANAGTGKNLQQIEATFNAEKAKISALEKQLQQLGLNPASVAGGKIVSTVSIKAPISGTVGHILINTGTYAETTKPLMDIIDNSQIHCDLTVYEKDLFKVKIGQNVSCILTNQNNQQIEGKIYGINKSFEDESKGITVHAIIDDPEKFRLIPGMYVTALIDVGNQQSNAVPVDAVVRLEGKDYIYLVEGNDKKTPADGVMRFKRVEVVSGLSELGYVQVSFPEEIVANASIVTKGAFYILSKSQGGAEEE